MPSIRTPSDYINAVRTASQGDVRRIPRSIQSVLIAKFGYGIGPRLHSLFSLCDLPRETWGDFLVDEKLRHILRSINPPNARRIAEDKLAFYYHCIKHSLQTIPVLSAVNVDSTLLHKAKEACITPSSETEFIASLTEAPDDLFFKPIDGTWGLGAFVAKRCGETWHFSDEASSASDIYRYLSSNLDSKRGWIVQPKIQPHSEIAKITSKQGLATIRMNTCLVAGETQVAFAVLRIPVGRNITDNFGHGASGNLVAPIDLKTGRLGKCRGSKSKEWPFIVDVHSHPDTGQKFEDFQIPRWDDVLDLIDRGQKSLPNLKTLGWDIAVTGAGPIIVETNTTYDVDLIQVAHQQGVEPQLRRIFSRINQGVTLAHHE